MCGVQNAVEMLQRLRSPGVSAWDMPFPIEPKEFRGVPYLETPMQFRFW